ncbi:MAG: IS200/IS605 family transposase [Cryomorphaceae bacterium]|nr:IS200/IS605 family transposase [Flavobacteriales bacterium]
MAQSLSKVYLHIIFGTKNWQPTIKDPYDEKLFAYIAGVCNSVDCAAIAVNGYLNHAHVLCRLAKNITISDLLETLKKRSSKWMKEQHESLENFYWQNGYAAFGIEEDSVERVSRYIRNQAVHHARVNYREEIIGLVKEHGVEYDERYFWK